MIVSRRPTNADPKAAAARVPGVVRVASSKLSPDLLHEEARIIVRACGGDRTAFADLVERYWQRLFRWLFHLTRDRHAAEDLAQETFLRAFAHLNRFQPGTNFAAWVFRIAHNAFANQCRAARKREPLPEELYDRGLGPVEEAVSREGIEDVARAVQQLPTDYRAALLLRVEEDLSFRQIADILDLTEETARWRVFKARQKLLGLLSPDADNDAESDAGPPVVRSTKIERGKP
jgi:RNA polymerase sigma-70 factor (ECF subfamily)